MKFKPVSVAGKAVDAALADIARGLNNLHECVHAGHEAQAERDDVADQKRAALAAEVGAIKTQQELDGGRITALSKALGTQQAAPGEKLTPPKVAIGWKEHLKVVATVGGCIGLVVFLYRMAVALAPAFHDFMLKVQT